MQHIETLVLGIQYKSKQVAEEIAKLHGQIEELKQQCRQLEDEIQQKNKLITELEQKEYILQIRNAVEENSNTTESKKKINELLRELDRCIDFLSNK